MEMNAVRQRHLAFTLIELLVVIVIVAVLMGLAFPVFQGVMNSAKKTQAKNDLTQIVTAVNAFYTEYGQYPCVAQSGDDTADYFTDTDAKRRSLFDNLRVPVPSAPPTANPRAIAFLQVPAVKNDAVGQRRAGVGNGGIFYDPWGQPYAVKIDSNYNATVTNVYDANTGAGPGILNSGVIAWSLGKDQTGGTGNKGVAGSKDDVISWQ
jgi:prepilin-type N-terminal cleavage/methylation domain-containing protein